MWHLQFLSTTRSTVSAVGQWSNHWISGAYIFYLSNNKRENQTTHISILIFGCGQFKPYQINLKIFQNRMIDWMVSYYIAFVTVSALCFEKSIIQIILWQFLAVHLFCTSIIALFLVIYSCILWFCDWAYGLTPIKLITMWNSNRNDSKQRPNKETNLTKIELRIEIDIMMQSAVRTKTDKQNNCKASK